MFQECITFYTHLTLSANATTSVLNSFFLKLLIQRYALMVLSETSEMILKDTLFKFRREGNSKLFTLKFCLLSWQSDSRS